MKIAMETKIVNLLNKLLEPILKKLFPDVSKEEEVHKEISMNIVANILGLGNAATPLGLKAMKSLQKKNTNKKVLSNSMAMFIVLNTASIQIIPTTVIAIRSSLGSQNPTAMIAQVWIATICAAFAAVISSKLLMKRWRE